MSKINSKNEVSTSYSFISRARCKKCAGRPFHYFFYKTGNLYVCPRQSMDMFNWITHVSRFCNNDYLMDDPSKYNSISNFSYPLIYKGYKCKLYNKLKTLPNRMYSDCMSCSCGATLWAFSGLSASERPEIFNRKSRNFILK